MLCLGDRQEQLNIKPRPYPSFIAKRGDWELKEGLQLFAGYQTA